MRKIALVNQKGGVGKTTTAVNLAAGLAELGKRVLLIDFDPQSNTTIAFGHVPGSLETSIYDVILGDATAADTLLQISENLDLLPSSIDLAGAEVELAHQIGRESILKDRLAALTDYEYVFVDCPPSLGLLNVNALTYVDEIFIPLQCEFFALQGISLLMKTIDIVQSRLNPGLTITGVIPCMYDARTSLAKEVVSEITSHFGDAVFQTKIRTNVRLAEAPSHGETIFQYAPESNGAEDYRNLAAEVAGVALEIAPAETETRRPLPNPAMRWDPLPAPQVETRTVAVQPPALAG
jgi:chromosome partitioning protein